MSAQISAEDRALVVSTIRKLFPDAKVLAFGSRIKGTAREFSDLDIAVDNQKPIDFSQWARLEEELANSGLKYKIDLSDFNRLTDEFKALILNSSEAW